MTLTPWRFDGYCTRVSDGDTQRYKVKLFEDEERVFIVRLLGINTPDAGIDGATYAEEKAATDYARSVLHTADPVTGVVAPVDIELYLTGKTDKYGRWIGMVYTPEGELGRLLHDAGHGEYKDYAVHLAELTG